MEQIGNTKLVQYGIFDEEAEFRAHLGVVTRQVYLFRVSEMLNLLQAFQYNRRRVTTDVAGARIVTAEGYLVPVQHIPHLLTVDVPEPRLRYYGLVLPEAKLTMGTTRKGEVATEIINRMLDSGELWLPLNGTPVTDRHAQIKGHDLIIVGQDHSIQTKCDWDAGPRERGGTGNLFIQYAECNPLKQK